jgi:hypothetical protein
MSMNLSPAAPKIRGDAAELQLYERSRYRAAAGHARRVYPGPLGELAYRELIAYAEFGYRFSDGGLPAISVLVRRLPPRLSAGTNRSFPRMAPARRLRARPRRGGPYRAGAYR